MGARGFTLIELLAVLAILALMLVAVPPMLSRGVPGAALKAAAQDVAAGLRQARSEAITRNRAVRFRLDLESRRFAIDGLAGERALPADVELVLTTAESEADGPDAGAIRFHPDGSSTGGGVTLGEGAREYRVLVDWLTGRVSVVR